jgi:cytochrome b involved in lipid metabolism
MSESLTPAQVKEHSTPETGLYIIIDNSVYSMASFADEHPGGSKILKRVGGKGKPSISSSSKSLWKGGESQRWGT